MFTCQAALHLWFRVFHLCECIPNVDRQFFLSRNRQLPDGEIRRRGKVLKRHEHEDDV